jgi:hypothetical protein
MRTSAREAGRDPDAIEVSAGGVFDVDGVKQYADLGVSRVMMPPLGLELETLKTQLGAFSENVIAKVG